MARRKPGAPLDPAAATTYPLRRRRSLVQARLQARVPRAGDSLAAFLAGLPDVLAAADLRTIATAIAQRHRRGRRIVLGMGAHPIKVGLGALVIDLMRRGVLSAVAVNGAAIVHDFELAYAGQTSEDVGAGLEDGSFGMARETGAFLNEAIADRTADEGLGETVGRALAAARLRHGELSLLRAGYELGIPVTVHVAVGTDIVHMHPSADGAAIGAGSLRDFHRLGGAVAGLRGGVFLNLGSAVVIPEVFVKALNLARNLGHRVDDLVTVDMDFLRHYRPGVNVVARPTATSGHGYRLTGHHEIMFPLLCAAVTEQLAHEDTRSGRRRRR